MSRTARAARGAAADEVAAPRWLDADEQRAWRALAAVLLRLPTALERQLRTDSDLTHFDYWVMALLSEAPDRTLRLAKLAAQADASLSRLSHAVSRLEAEGWVERRPCPDDERATLGVLTDAGYAQVVAAAPGHVAEVRRLVFDGLGARDVAALERIAAAIGARLDGAVAVGCRGGRSLVSQRDTAARDRQHRSDRHHDESLRP